MNCELCGGYIDSAPGYKIAMHWSCLDKVLDALGPRPQSPAEWARRCPDIHPNQTGNGRIVRKQIT